MDGPRSFYVFLACPIAYSASWPYETSPLSCCSRGTSRHLVAGYLFKTNSNELLRKNRWSANPGPKPESICVACHGFGFCCNPKWNLALRKLAISNLKAFKRPFNMLHLFAVPRPFNPRWNIGFWRFPSFSPHSEPLMNPSQVTWRLDCSNDPWMDWETRNESKWSNTSNGGIEYTKMYMSDQQLCISLSLSIYIYMHEAYTLQIIR